MQYFSMSNCMSILDEMPVTAEDCDKESSNRQLSPSVEGKVKKKTLNFTRMQSQAVN